SVPPPPCGEGSGVGGVTQPTLLLDAPPSLSLPRKGGGDEQLKDLAAGTLSRLRRLVHPRCRCAHAATPIRSRPHECRYSIVPLHCQCRRHLRAHAFFAFS